MSDTKEPPYILDHLREATHQLPLLTDLPMDLIMVPVHCLEENNQIVPPASVSPVHIIRRRIISDSDQFLSVRMISVFLCVSSLLFNHNHVFVILMFVIFIKLINSIFNIIIKRPSLSLKSLDLLQNANKFQEEMQHLQHSSSAKIPNIHWCWHRHLSLYNQNVDKQMLGTPAVKL